MPEEDNSDEGSKGRKGKKSERTVFTVWEIDKNDKAPSTPCFESFGNPIPSIRYAYRNNKRNKRFNYVVSPRPSDNMFIAAGVKKEHEPWKL